jgi:hypothetical protein
MRQKLLEEGLLLGESTRQIASQYYDVLRQLKLPCDWYTCTHSVRLVGIQAWSWKEDRSTATVKKQLLGLTGI